MAEFSPEYVELCRKLALEHEFQPGDWFVGPRAGYPTGFDAEEPMLVDLHAQEWPGKGAIWLPLEGDWLRMLEEAGVYGVTIERASTTVPVRDFLARATMWEPDLGDLRTMGLAPTRLEALARLWMAVTGRDA